MNTLLIVLLSFFHHAFADFTIEFTSPQGLQEICRSLPAIPTGHYSKKDAETEGEYCSYDFYKNPTLALCPKTWSTSPGTMIYDISDSGLTTADYEAQKSCGGSKSGHSTIVKFKQTMNQSGTSGTYSPSSLVYYHFSRYFDTTVEVPVAVYRTMDRDSHFSRVTQKAHEKKMGKGEMIRKGWEWLYKSEKNPDSYKPTLDLFTEDLSQIYGVLVGGKGERYGAEINGVRKGGNSQYAQFQETPAYLSLREPTDLQTAIQIGLKKGLQNSEIKKAMGPGASDLQMMIWMKELTEIVLLDYIFSQQDRVGNIDYKWYLYWVDENGSAQDKKWDPESDSIDISRSNLDQLEYPKTMNGLPTHFIQRTRINDNDAGARFSYANRAKKYNMLKNIYHMSAETYSRLNELNKDFQNRRPIHQYLSTQFRLSEKDILAIVNNTNEAWLIFNSQCKQGQLRFDLFGPKQILEGKNNPISLACE